MSPHGEALALARDALASSRKSATRIVNLHVARAISRGRLPHLAEQVEAGLLDDLNRRRGDRGIEITWHAHAEQPEKSIARLSWCPGTPLPDRTLFVSCTASAPLRD